MYILYICMYIHIYIYVIYIIYGSIPLIHERGSREIIPNRIEVTRPQGKGPITAQGKDPTTPQGKGPSSREGPNKGPMEGPSKGPRERPSNGPSSVPKAMANINVCVQACLSWFLCTKSMRKCYMLFN